MEKTSVFERMRINKLKKEVEKLVEDNSSSGLFNYYNKLKDKDKVRVSNILEEIILISPSKIELLSSKDGIKNPFNIDLLKVAGVKFEGENQVDSKVDYLVVLLNLAKEEELSNLLSFYLKNCDETFDINYYHDMFKAILGKKYFDILKEEHIDSFVMQGIYALEAKEILASPKVLKNNKIMVLAPEELPRDFILSHPEVLNSIYTNNLVMRSFTAEEIMNNPEILKYPEITVTNGEKLSKRFILKHPEVLSTRINNLDFSLSFEDLKSDKTILENPSFHRYVRFTPKIKHFLEIPELLSIEALSYKEVQNSLLFEYLTEAIELLPYEREEQKDFFASYVQDEIEYRKNSSGYEFSTLALIPFIKMIEDAKSGNGNIDNINAMFQTFIITVERNVNLEYAKALEEIYFNPNLILGIHGGSARIEQYLEEGLMNRIEGNQELAEACTPTVRNTVLLQFDDEDRERSFMEMLAYSYGVKGQRNVIVALPKEALYPTEDTEDIALWHSIGVNKRNEYISYLPNNYIAGIHELKEKNYIPNPNYNPNILYEVKTLEDGTKMVVDKNFAKTKLRVMEGKLKEH